MLPLIALAATLTFSFGANIVAGDKTQLQGAAFGLTVNQEVPLIIESCKQAEKSGTYSLSLPGTSNTIPVLCEAESFNGGWLVIQQRINGTENFNRNWKDYKQGFGSIEKSSEFWLGLEQMHQLTKNDVYDLIVEVKDDSGQYGYALFTKFKIADEGDNYRLFNEFRWSEGTINFGLQLSHGEQFSTPDRDHDKSSEHCGSLYKSGWWFYKCRFSNLNGPYRKDPETGRGIYWHDWAIAATYSRMMIRQT